MPTLAAIDVGSNAIRLIIGSVNGQNLPLSAATSLYT